MRTKHQFKRGALTVGILLAGASYSVLAQQNGGDIEEVVITGSFIRGTPLDAPSPVQVVDRESIEAQGAAVIWDVIKNLEVNSGSFTNPGNAEAVLSGQTEGTAQVNLRNLGENSTLTLINGKRMAPAAATTSTGGEFVDINAIPNVMTDRVEILTDGGSGLYGADAVAGVVNIIMRNDFEGLELYGDLQNMTAAGNAFDQTLSGIWGWRSENGRTHLVISGERFERDPVSILDANFINANSEFVGTVTGIGGAVAVPTFGAQLNPAYLATDIIAQNVAEGGPPDPVFSDPLCTAFSSIDGDPFQVGELRELRGERTGNCFEDVSNWKTLARETTRNSLALSFDHSFSDQVEFYAFANYSENKVVVEGEGVNNTGSAVQSRGPTVFLATPGAYARSPELFGQSLGQTMELGYFADRIGLIRPGAGDIPNAPVDIANGGINTAFWSNIYVGLPRDGRDSNSTETDYSLIQTGLRGDFTVKERPWTYDVGYSWSATSLEQTYQTLNREHSELAANGLGGPGCVPNGVPDFDFQNALNVPAFGPLLPSAWEFFGPSFTQTLFPRFVFTTRESLSYALTSTNQGQGPCQFYNPLLTQFNDPSLANSPELVDWMVERVLRADKRNKLAVFDALVSGELFDLAGGPAAFALGGQYRERNAKSIAPVINDPGLPNRILGYDETGAPNEFHDLSNNFECAECIFNFDNTRTVKAVFGELSLPFADSVESQIAVRWEDYGDIGSELSPKLALSWRPVESLLLRGSWSQSFRAPNIGIVEEGLEAGEIDFRDPISSQRVRAGLAEPTVQNAEVETTFTLSGPAPDVGNEYADTYNLGFIWTPVGRFEGLSVQADYWRFEVRDRVLPEPGISAVQPEIEAFLTARANPDNYVLNSTVGISTENVTPFTACDPNALAAEFGRESPERLDCVVDPRSYQVLGIQRDLTSSDANLVTLTLAAINAGEIEADGVDLRLAYSWGTSLGQFRLSADYTHVHQYRLINVPGLEFGLLETGVFDAAGTSGDGLLVRSLPDNKGNITFNWQRDRHGVTVINRHIGSYQDLAYDNEFINRNDTVRSLLSRKVDSYQTWDVQYRYHHDWGNANLGSTTFSLGALDLFNAEIPRREASALQYDASVFDPRGRRVYARVRWGF